ncbi:helix-turn-helix domain-containing protein [Vibrio sp. MA40-2]|uniref:helix-turn-helix domain-containing protein n=1 Tax=Vibrio sp. MA40-2 TaxID=3391828 RepID=UPI0039A66F95
MSDLFSGIGDRLKAYRLGRNLSPEVVADLIGVSRAALYRYEKGVPPKLETLEKISEVLEVSLPTLLGVGVEYIASCLSFMERMRQIESETHHISALFGPISYLLTTDTYDTMLHEVLIESLPDEFKRNSEALNEISTITDILKERKKNYSQNKPSILSLVSISELERFIHNGFIGHYNLSDTVKKYREEVARKEVQNIVNLLEEQPIGVQLGVLIDTIPNSNFQIFRQKSKDIVAISPFSLGDLPNIRLGVAMITNAPDAVKFHSNITNNLWDRSLKGIKAIDYINKNLI